MTMLSTCGRGKTDRELVLLPAEFWGPREALAACRAGDKLVVTKLDRLARSVPDAHNIAKEVTAGGQAEPWRFDPRSDRRDERVAVHHSRDDRRV